MAAVLCISSWLHICIQLHFSLFTIYVIDAHVKLFVTKVNNFSIDVYSLLKLCLRMKVFGIRRRGFEWLKKQLALYVGI